MNTVVESG